MQARSDVQRSMMWLRQIAQLSTTMSARRCEEARAAPCEQCGAGEVGGGEGG